MPVALWSRILWKAGATSSTQSVELNWTELKKTLRRRMPSLAPADTALHPCHGFCWACEHSTGASPEWNHGTSMQGSLLGREGEQPLWLSTSAAVSPQSAFIGLVLSSYTFSEIIPILFRSEVHIRLLTSYDVVIWVTAILGLNSCWALDCSLPLSSLSSLARHLPTKRERMAPFFSSSFFWVVGPPITPREASLAMLPS